MTRLFIILLTLMIAADVFSGDPSFAEDPPFSEHPPAQSPSKLPAASDGDDALPLPESIRRFADAAKEKWDSDIRKLEALVAGEPNDPQNILMIGSSSVRLWAESGHLRRDLAPFPVIARGYGGAKYTDVAVFADRLITHEPCRALVLFVGNDVAGKKEDRTLTEIGDAVGHILAVAHRAHAKLPIILIEVTPTPSRYHARDAQVAMNARLRRIAIETPHIYFLPTWEHFLAPDGQPLEGLFRKDRLHLNDDGYELWSALIRRRLTEVLRLEARYKDRTGAEAASAE